MRLIFMGTPDFAADILRALAARHDVCAAVTQPDKPVGRKGALTPTPVKTLAEALGVPVLQPTRLKPPAFAEGLRAYGAEAAVVAAYGRILPPPVLDAFPKGCLNVHASLLPKYRGASPIQGAIVNGEAETGVTIMRMDEGLDTGDILLCRAIPILPGDTAGSLFERLSALGAALILEALDRSDILTPTPQDHTKATHTRIINKDDGKINWRDPAAAIVNLVRGMNPWPTAFTTMDGQTVKIWRAEAAEGTDAPPGTVVAASRKDGLVVAAGGGSAVRVLELQAPGGKRLAASDYLNGRKITHVL